MTTKATRNVGKKWTPGDVKALKELAGLGTPLRVIALKLGRREEGVRRKARAEGVGVRETRAPYRKEGGAA